MFTKINIYILSIFFFISSCSSRENKEDIEIGKILPKEAKVIDDNFLMLYEPNSTKPAKSILYNNVNYVVYLASDRKTKAIITYDNRFISPENYKVGVPYSKIKTKLKELIIPGYGCHIELPSGWTAIIIDNGVLVNHLVADTSTVKSFYKTDFGSWASKYQPRILD